MPAVVSRPEPVSPPEPLFSRQKAASFLGVSLRCLDARLASGELTRVRIGACVRIDPADLRKFIEDAKEGE